jgi:hypothetical protein
VPDVRVGAALVFLAALCFYVPLARHGALTEDEGWLLDSAMRVAAGQVPHRDFASIYPAGRYYVAALVLELAGQDVGGLRLYQAVLRAVVVVLTFDLGRRLMPLPFAFGAAATVLLAPGPWHKTSVVLVPLAGLWCFAAWLPRRETRWLVLVGLVAGLGAFFRQDQAAFLLLGAALGVVMHAPLQGRGARAAVAPLLVLGGSAFAAALPGLVLLQSAGALRPAVDQVLEELVLRNSAPEVAFGVGALELRRLPALPFVLALVGFGVSLLRRSQTLLCLATIVFCGAGEVSRSPILVRFLQQGALYALVWCALAAALRTLALRCTRPGTRGLLHGLWAVSWLGPVVLAAYVTAGLPERGEALEYVGSPRLGFVRRTPFEARGGTLYGPPDFALVPELVAHVRAATAPGEPILALCKLSSLYFLAERPNPTHRTRLALEQRRAEELQALGREIGDSGCRLVVATHATWQRALAFCREYVGRELVPGPRFGPYVVAELAP